MQIESLAVSVQLQMDYRDQCFSDPFGCFCGLEAFSISRICYLNWDYLSYGSIGHRSRTDPIGHFWRRCASDPSQHATTSSMHLYSPATGVMAIGHGCSVAGRGTVSSNYNYHGRSAWVCFFFAFVVGSFCADWQSWISKLNHFWVFAAPCHRRLGH